MLKALSTLLGDFDGLDGHTLPRAAMYLSKTNYIIVYVHCRMYLRELQTIYENGDGPEQKIIELFKNCQL